MTQKEKVSEVVSYCWAHAEGSKEEEMVQWMAEHLAVAMKSRYDLPAGGNRRLTIDGTAGKSGSLVVRTAAV